MYEGKDHHSPQTGRTARLYGVLSGGADQPVAALLSELVPACLTPMDTNRICLCVLTTCDAKKYRNTQQPKVLKVL